MHSDTNWMCRGEEKRMEWKVKQATTNNDQNEQQQQQQKQYIQREKKLKINYE